MCLTLCDPMDCSLSGSSVPGDAPGKNTEWVDMPSSRGSSQPTSPASQAVSLPSEPPEPTALSYSCPNFQSVRCSMSSSNCCFLTCIQISQEAGQVVWCSHLWKNFPQFVVIHTIKGFGIINKAEIGVFLELSCFFHDPADAS